MHAVSEQAERGIDVGARRRGARVHRPAAGNYADHLNSGKLSTNFECSGTARLGLQHSRLSGS